MSADREKIAQRAYQLWESRGRPEGEHESTWMDAERELRESPGAADSRVVEQSSKESFPASDPPASHLPDRPPSNADQKWRAAGIDREDGGAMESGGAPGRVRK